MSTINERVRIVKDYYFQPEHGSVKAFAKAMNENPKKVSNWMVDGYSVKDTPIRSIMLAFPDVRYEWLAFGEEPMLKSQIADGLFIPLPIKNDLAVVLENDYMMAELKDLETAAGKLWKNGVDIQLLPKSKRRLVSREYEKGNYLVVRVHGHSMDDGTKRSIMDDDEILIRQSFESIVSLPIRHKLFVINTIDGSVVKQILKIDTDKKQIICHSFNPNYPDYEINFDALIQIFTVEIKVKSKIIF